MKRTGYRKKTWLDLFLSRNSTGAPLRQREDCPFWERASQIYAYIILVLFPLLITPQTYYNITEVKFYSFVALTGLYALSCVVIGFVFFLGRRRGRFLREKRRIGLTLPQIALLAYVLWAVISTLASPYSMLFLGQSRYEGLLSILLYATAFVLLSFWGEYTDAYITGLAVMGTITGFIALLQSFGSTMLYPGDYDYWNSSFLTTIGNVDCVAGIICILVPALLCGFVIIKEKTLFCLPALFLMTYIMVFSDVDTAKLGFLAALLMIPTLIESRERLQRLLIGLVPILLGFSLGFFWSRNQRFTPGIAPLFFLLAAAGLGFLAWYMKTHARTWRVSPSVIRRAGYALMLALLVIALIVVYNYGGQHRLLREASDMLHGELADGAGSGRGRIWKNTLRLIAERPILGGGPGSFLTLHYPYNTTKVFDFAHNDFLNIAACTGLVGLALYLCFLITLAVRCIRRAGACPVLLILLAGMAGYLVYSFFVFSIAIVSPLFWVMAGVADKCVRQSDPVKTPPEEPAEG